MVSKKVYFLRYSAFFYRGNVATVTRQRVYKAMVTPITEVLFVFIGEATESTPDVDEWQISTQGGYSAHSVKYQGT